MIALCVKDVLVQFILFVSVVDIVWFVTILDMRDEDQKASLYTLYEAH